MGGVTSRPGRGGRPGAERAPPGTSATHLANKATWVPGHHTYMAIRPETTEARAIDTKEGRGKCFASGTALLSSPDFHMYSRRVQCGAPATLDKGPALRDPGRKHGIRPHPFAVHQFDTACYLMGFK